MSRRWFACPRCGATTEVDVRFGPGAWAFVLAMLVAGMVIGVNL